MSKPISLTTRIAGSAVIAIFPGIITAAGVGWIFDIDFSPGLFVVCAAPFFLITMRSVGAMDRNARASDAYKTAWAAERADREAAGVRVADAERAAAAQAQIDAAAQAERAAAAQAQIDAANQDADQALFDDLVRDAHKKLQ